MGSAIVEYTFRIFRADGGLSLVMVMSASSERDALHQACGLLTDKLPLAEIWQNTKLVDTIRIEGGAVPSSPLLATATICPGLRMS